jgi:3-oxoacyl-[acyl-carrier protein] reductase
LSRALADPPVTLVTGSNRGLGYGIACAFRDAGHRIVSLNRTLRGEPWLGEIACDLARPGEVAGALASLRGEISTLHTCVLNAAVRRLAPIDELATEDWSDSVAVNLSGAVHVVRGTLPWVRSARGVYVVVGSHAADRYFEGGLAYSATKAGLRALVETLLLEERAHGVRAMLVSAGAIANRAGDLSPNKMAPEAVGRLVRVLVEQCPADIAIGEVEIRPARLDPPAVGGIARLQGV